jgi:plasmid stabilization system protein ParE
VNPGSLVIRPAFWDDLVEAVRWYEEQEPGVGAQLEDEVVRRLESIAERPRSFPVWRGDVRRASLRRFPYTFAFVIEDEQVFVLGLVHGMRDLPRWVDRRLGNE